MVFNSFGFLAFFTLVVFTCYVIPYRYRWGLLLAASLYSYGSFKLAFLPLLLGVTLVAYVSGLGIAASTQRPRKRAILIAGILAVLGPLIIIKYYDFFLRSLSGLLTRTGDSEARLPLLGIAVAAGLSFYTFSCISYLADVYAGRLPAERHLGHFALYVSFFPKLLAGPLERAKPFLAQARRPAAFDSAAVTAGLELMLWGLFKKVVIADRLSPLVDAAYRQPSLAPTADLVLATYFFAFQLYCDFSGYSDIAIGAAKVLGFDLMENFRRPYLSTSVREFWTQRWHLSLAAWFRDYQYIPLGGNRRSQARVYANIMSVFLVSGLWHGANWTFVVWGGLNGLYVVMSPLASRAGARLVPIARLPAVVRSFLSGLLTFHLVLLTWVFFRASSLSDALTVFSRVGKALPGLPGLIRTRLGNAEILFAIALIGLLLVFEAFDERRPLWERLRVRPRLQRWAVYYVLIFSLIVLGSWGLQQFVYMQF